MRKYYPLKKTGIVLCSIDGCDDFYFARGWCSKHYTRWYKHGDPLFFQERKTDEERYWPRVDIRGPEECWPWIGYLNRDGYAQFKGGGEVLGHRFVYQLLIGPIPEGLTIDHLCRNPSCQNPAHMEPVPGEVNTMRGEGITAINSRKTHCKNGHEFTLDNTWIRKRNGKRTRVCKECNRLCQFKYRSRIRRTKEYPKECL